MAEHVGGQSGRSPATKTPNPDSTDKKNTRNDHDFADCKKEDRIEPGSTIRLSEDNGKQAESKNEAFSLVENDPSSDPPKPGECACSETSLLSGKVKNAEQIIIGAQKSSNSDTHAKAALRFAYPILHKANLVKNKIFTKLFGPMQHPPPSNGRCIEVDASRENALVDNRTGKEYIGNTITSSRYSVWNFIPRQLYFQFSKLANAYFLLVSILQITPGLSTTGTYTTIAPLLVFVTISICKEGYDDFRRYKLDQVENSREALVLRTSRSVTEPKYKRSRWGMRGLTSRREKNTSSMSKISEADKALEGPCWTTLKWEKIRVGDIVKLHRNDHVPADIVLLRADGPNGIAYIETMALDGETNLKSKQAPTSLINQIKSMDQISTCRAQVMVEDPNIDLYNFEGRITVGNETLPLTTNEVVLRGSTLRNTKSAIGMVFNTGEECKIRMNANKESRIKAPKLQNITNRIVLILVFFVLLLAIFCTIAYRIWSATTEKNAFYLRGAHVNSAQIFFGFFILYNTLIPLSLYINLEVIKIGQMLLMDDIDIYDPVSNTPMVVNTTTILENLGQINYIFSDKTGTLTDNVMQFRKLSVAGYAWLHDFDISGDAAKYSDTKKSNPHPTKILELKPETPKIAGVANPPVLKTNIPHRSDSTWSSSARTPKSPNMTKYRTKELLKFLQYKPHSVFTKKARFFLLSLALCHTCLPEVGDDGKVQFQAASPDELALVQASQELGWLIIDRAARSITLSYPDALCSAEKSAETYEILDVIEFSSKRKRMSIIVRFPDGRICIFCKGADSIISPRLNNASLALQKKSDVFRKSSLRKSMEAENALKRLSPRTSFSQTSISLSRQRSTGQKRSSLANPSLQPIRDELDSWLRHREQSDQELPPENPNLSAPTSPRVSMQRQSFTSLEPLSKTEKNDLDNLVDEAIAIDEVAIFERCFQHIDQFASEGLRTLLFAHRFLDHEEYSKWKKIYTDATTSLVDRQELIEKAGDLIEQDFDLSGATAIEDKLQKGVPETIDKLRRANIKIWMLTGDKRETAITIAYSARLCKSFSEIIILDHAKRGVEEVMTSSLSNLQNKKAAHTVIVVDGQTLSDIDSNETLARIFFDLVILADSVICCRASPSQKSSLVKRVRTKVAKSTTLAIGDGANDIAMILEAHVGIGLSGKEGLQAARISDYSIAQFRFLQKLLLVHGRWNYVRTSKYILCTFWKELVFYLLQAMYQGWTGFTGTSLFESTSLTVFNSLFTSLSVIIIGIFEQDLSATTLLAVPELYVQGQQDDAFNVRKYLGWMALAISETTIIFFTMFGLFGSLTLTQDNNLLAMGTLCFTVSLIFINTKILIFEMHNKTILNLVSWIVTVFGWFMWQILLSGVFKPGKTYPLYPIKGGFLHHFGAHALWWLVLILGLACLVVLELGVSSIRKTFWPTDTDVFQELQRDALIRRRFEDTLEAEKNSTVSQVEMGREDNHDRCESEIEALLDQPRGMRGEDAEMPRGVVKSEMSSSAITTSLINRALSKAGSRPVEIEMAERETTSRPSANIDRPSL